MAKYQGYYQPKNPKKYKGDPTNIIYRSSWELKLMMYLDTHQDIISWSSEELIIPYRSPIDNRIHRYYPDFICSKMTNGKKEVIVIEVKPDKQTRPPDPRKKGKRYLSEVTTWGINEAKWKAAKEFCADRKWKFMIMTEKELGINF